MSCDFFHYSLSFSSIRDIIYRVSVKLKQSYLETIIDMRTKCLFLKVFNSLKYRFQYEKLSGS